MNDTNHTSDRSIEIVPTCVPRTIEDLRLEIQKIRSFSESIHIDIVDGVFASGATWPFSEGSSVGEFDISGMDVGVFDAHLMVSDPREIGELFIKAGARSIIAHVESFSDVHQAKQTIDMWRGLDVKRIGLAVLLGTPLKNLERILPFSDFIHVLSVASIGAQGAPFDNRAIERVAELHDRYPPIPISVDGGVSAGTIGSLVRAGATRFAVGAGIMHVSDPALAYAQIKSLAEHAVQ